MDAVQSDKGYAPMATFRRRHSAPIAMSAGLVVAVVAAQPGRCRLSLATLLPQGSRGPSPSQGTTAGDWLAQRRYLRSQGLSGPARCQLRPQHVSGISRRTGITLFMVPSSVVAMGAWSLRSRASRRRGRGTSVLSSASRSPQQPDVVPPTRWAGGGVASTDSNVDLASLEVADECLTLRRDMKVEEVIRALLTANAVCATSSENKEVFYVRVDPTGVAKEDALCCISLGDLLDAPRSMPLDCLIGSGEVDEEECELYANVMEPYSTRGVMTELEGRLPWLVGLLVFLTVSSAILEYYDAMLQRHLIIAFYLTALVGCGGNSGSQASSLVLQALATGEVVPNFADSSKILQKEFLVSVGIAVTLSIGVTLRIVLFGGSWADAATIAFAMFVTVIFSVVFGAAAPLGLRKAGFDPAKVSGPLLSTVIDIVGVLVACLSAVLLEASGAYN